MTKFLDLDSFESSIDKTVKINGKTHAFQPFSVKDFIEQLKVMEAAAQREEMPVSEYMEQMVGTVKRAFPSIPDEDIQTLTLEKLKKLTDFVRGETEREVLEGLPEEEAEEQKKE